jgi:hypothetical protein
MPRRSGPCVLTRCRAWSHPALTACWRICARQEKWVEAWMAQPSPSFNVRVLLSGSSSRCRNSTSVVEISGSYSGLARRNREVDR